MKKSQMKFGELQYFIWPERLIKPEEMIAGHLPLSPPGYRLVLSITRKVTPHFQ